METSKDAFLLRGEVGRGEHQHRVKRVHDTAAESFITIPLCLNYRVCEMPPVSRWSGCMWHFGFSPFKSIMVESADSRRSLLPLYIKTQKMPRSSHREIFSAFFLLI